MLGSDTALILIRKILGQLKTSTLIGQSLGEALTKVLMLIWIGNFFHNFSNKKYIKYTLTFVLIIKGVKFE